jgi:hypothetical protein
VKTKAPETKAFNEMYQRENPSAIEKNIESIMGDEGEPE